MQMTNICMNKGSNTCIFNIHTRVPCRNVIFIVVLLHLHQGNNEYILEETDSQEHLTDLLTLC